MKVYLLTYHIPYEGEYNIGIYSTLESAQAAMKEEAISKGSDYLSDTNHGLYYKLAWGTELSITEWEVK